MEIKLKDTIKFMFDRIIEKNNNSVENKSSSNNLKNGFGICSDYTTDKNADLVVAVFSDNNMVTVHAADYVFKKDSFTDTQTYVPGPGKEKAVFLSENTAETADGSFVTLCVYSDRNGNIDLFYSAPACENENIVNEIPEVTNDFPQEENSAENLSESQLIQTVSPQNKPDEINNDVSVLLDDIYEENEEDNDDSDTEDVYFSVIQQNIKTPTEETDIIETASDDKYVIAEPDTGTGIFMNGLDEEYDIPDCYEETMSEYVNEKTTPYQTDVFEKYNAFDNNNSEETSYNNSGGEVSQITDTLNRDEPEIIDEYVIFETESDIEEKTEHEETVFAEKEENIPEENIVEINNETVEAESYVISETQNGDSNDVPVIINGEAKNVSTEENGIQNDNETVNAEAFVATEIPQNDSEDELMYVDDNLHDNESEFRNENQNSELFDTEQNKHPVFEQNDVENEIFETLSDEQSCTTNEEINNENIISEQPISNIEINYKDNNNENNEEKTEDLNFENALLGDIADFGLLKI